MMYSFGKTKKGYIGKNSNPGPGTYEPIEKNNIYRSSPNHKIGTSDRLQVKKSEAPGPGTYDHYQNTGVGFSFGSKLGVKSTSRNQFTPGPGSYEQSLPNKYSGPSYSLGGKKYKQNANTTPGPGEYEYKSTITGVPTAKLGTGKRTGFQSKETPGPGSYGDNFRPFSANSIGGKFGTANRMTDGKNDKYKANYAPGPGAYEHESQQQQYNKGISMGIRKGELYDKEKAKVPGPGSYNANKFIPTKNICMGTSSQRAPVKDNGTPGPGQYDKGFIDKKNAGACRMGTSTRRPLSAAQDTPGPGNYNYQEKIAEGPKYHFGAKPREEESNEYHQSFKPAPGQYQPDYNITQSKQATFAFGREPRDKPIKSEAPGPGQYDTRKKVEGPQFGFGSAPREQKIKSDDPGPGAYEQGGTIGKVPKYLLPNGSKAK